MSLYLSPDQHEFLYAHFNVLDPVTGETGRDFSDLLNCNAIILLNNNDSVQLNNIHANLLRIFEGRNASILIEGPGLKEFSIEEFDQFKDYPRSRLATYTTIEGKDHVETHFPLEENFKWHRILAINELRNHTEAAVLMQDMFKNGAITFDQGRFNVVEGMADLINAIELALSAWEHYFFVEESVKDFEKLNITSYVASCYFDSDNFDGENIRLACAYGINFIFMDEADLLGNDSLMSALTRNNFKVKVLAPKKRIERFSAKEIKIREIEIYDAEISITFKLLEEQLRYFPSYVKEALTCKVHKLSKTRLVEMSSQFLHNFEPGIISVKGVDYDCVAQFQQEAQVHLSSQTPEEIQKCEAHQVWRRIRALDKIAALQGISMRILSSAPLECAMVVRNHRWYFELKLNEQIPIMMTSDSIQLHIDDFFRFVEKKCRNSFSFPKDHTLMLYNAELRYGVHRKTCSRNELEPILTLLLGKEDHVVHVQGDFDAEISDHIHIYPKSELTISVTQSGLSYFLLSNELTVINEMYLQGEA